MSLVADNSSSRSSSGGQKKLFRALVPLMPVTGLMRTPCGVCPVRLKSSPNFGTFTKQSLEEILQTPGSVSLGISNTKKCMEKLRHSQVFFNPTLRSFFRAYHIAFQTDSLNTEKMKESNRCALYSFMRYADLYATSLRSVVSHYNLSPDLSIVRQEILWKSFAN